VRAESAPRLAAAAGQQVAVLDAGAGQRDGLAARRRLEARAPLHPRHLGVRRLPRLAARVAQALCQRVAIQPGAPQPRGTRRRGGRRQQRQRRAAERRRQRAAAAGRAGGGVAAIVGGLRGCQRLLRPAATRQRARGRRHRR